MQTYIHNLYNITADRFLLKEMCNNIMLLHTVAGIQTMVLPSGAAGKMRTTHLNGDIS